MQQPPKHRAGPALGSGGDDGTGLVLPWGQVVSENGLVLPWGQVSCPGVRW